LHRLGEAKGAVELLLAECYVRRDRVALLAFRGRGAELILPPTRSLARAKRSLAGLPGGGGTPLASAIDAAVELAEATRRQGDTPLLVFLTDGRANLTSDGRPDRAMAESQALAAARRVRADGLRAVLVDTAPRPQPLAARVATEMGARYLPLPHAHSTQLTTAIGSAAHA
jgi:magnesium chelatase subunit D